MAEKMRKIVIGYTQPDQVYDPLDNLDLEDDHEDLDFSDGSHDMSEVQRRCDDVDQATAEYLLFLMDLEGCDIEDLGVTKATLSAIQDGIEEVLANFGLFIYRPLFVKDDQGNEVFKYCQYEDEIAGYSCGT